MRDTHIDGTYIGRDQNGVGTYASVGIADHHIVAGRNAWRDGGGRAVVTRNGDVGIP